MNGADLGLVLAVFIACVVETVEAVTIFLAIGLSRGWRSAWMGATAGLLVLSVIVAIVGSAVGSLPLHSLRLFVGGVLLVFGLQWLRKAIMRASGLKDLHDEDEAFRQERLAADRAGTASDHGIDSYGFTIVFKSVLLEGLEVVFIVVTLGVNQNNLGIAALGAAAAIVLTVALAFAVRKPLSRIPENTLKFTVGVMLTSFGAFWSAEGAGIEWPAGDLALIVVTVYVLAISLILVKVFRSDEEMTRGGVGP